MEKLHDRGLHEKNFFLIFRSIKCAFSARMGGKKRVMIGAMRCFAMRCAVLGENLRRRACVC